MDDPRNGGGKNEREEEETNWEECVCVEGGYGKLVQLLRFHGVI